MEALDVAAMSRMAAQLSGCLKAGCVQEEVAGLSRSVFPEALLLSVSVPSAGLTDILLIGCNNFLEEGHTLCSLSSLQASSAGQSFSRRQLFDSGQPRQRAGFDEPARRLVDAEDAHVKWGVDRLLCCPIPLSLGAAIARQPVDGDEAAAGGGAAHEALGVVTLGLRKGACMTAGATEALQELARQLAETIERDSAALVDDVCMLALGRPREAVDAPCAGMSPTCSDETQPGGGTGGGSAPSSGSQGIPVAPEGGAGGGAGGGSESGSPGGARAGAGAGEWEGQTATRGQGKGQPECCNDESWGTLLATCAPARPAAPVSAPGAAAPAGAAANRSANEDTAMGWEQLGGRQRRSTSLGADSSCRGKGGAALPWDANLKQRISGIHTFDAAAAGGAKSAFEAAAACDGGGKEQLCFARSPLLTFRDARTEARFVAFHAAKRWRVDAAFLFMLLAICALAGYSGGAVALARHSAAACAVHALPLLVIVCQLPWYLRNREAVLATWLVAAAAVSVYAAGRGALRVDTGGGLNALVAFSRAQAAEPLLFHALMGAVRARTALAVQAVCVAVAASNAAAVCATCCAPLLSPAYCLLKAYATQAVFGYGLPILVLYFTEDSFRYVFAEITKHSY